MAEPKARVLYGITGTFIILTWIVVPLRIYTRIFIRKSFGVDDVFAILAFVFNSVLSGFVMYGAYVGIGRHITALSVTQISDLLQNYFFDELLYTITTCLIKVSFSLMLIRITDKRWMSQVAWLLVSITVVFSVFYFFFILFACQPIEYFWTSVKGASGHCRNSAGMIRATYAHGAAMILIDVSLVILPFLLVLSLQLKRKQKLTVFALLALGSIMSVATIARMTLVHHIADTDFTYGNYGIAVWSIVEVNIGILATSLSTLRPLVAKLGIMATSTIASRDDSKPSHGYHRRPALRSNKGSSVGAHSIQVTDEFELYHQYYPGADRNTAEGPGAITSPSRSFRLGFRYAKDAIKVPSVAS